MPYKDAETSRVKAAERQRRWRAKKHRERYGEGAGPQNGKHGKHAKGSSNGRWNEGRLMSSHGYVLVRVGDSHPLCVGNQYAYEHHVVWVSANGAIPDGYVVHHANGDKTDNRLDNLHLMTVSEHHKHHSEERERDDLGRFK